MPAIAVPVPTQSVSPRPLPTVTSAPTATRPLNCWRLASTPVSTTAIFTPLPRVRVHALSAAIRSCAQSERLLDPATAVQPAVSGCRGGGSGRGCASGWPWDGCRLGLEAPGFVVPGCGRGSPGGRKLAVLDPLTGGVPGQHQIPAAVEPRVGQPETVRLHPTGVEVIDLLGSLAAAEQPPRDLGQILRLSLILRRDHVVLHVRPGRVWGSPPDSLRPAAAGHHHHEQAGKVEVLRQHWVSSFSHHGRERPRSTVYCGFAPHPFNYREQRRTRLNRRPVTIVMRTQGPRDQMMGWFAGRHLHAKPADVGDSSRTARPGRSTQRRPAGDPPFRPAPAPAGRRTLRPLVDPRRRVVWCCPPTRPVARRTVHHRPRTAHR